MIALHEEPAALENELARVTHDLLETPGAQRVTFAWVDAITERLCVSELRPGDRAEAFDPQTDRKAMFLVGRFPLEGDASSGEVTAAMNELRSRAGLPPLRCTMFSHLHMGDSGQWEGAIKISAAVALVA
ncbi:MAG TPA: hypothetical protein VGN72_22815 [Tepidisphaeraceae bacterium]|jgi:hypothetical protein|nr:hypothetical protein [Tepidisphaeraceae bacterium]